jgi:hypothetical protein
MTSVPRRIVAFALALPLALPSGLLAQQQPAPPPAAPSDRPVLQLSLDDAVKRALENNLDIQVAQYDPKGADESIRLAKGAYDPLASSNLTTRSTTQRATNIFAGAQEVTTDTDIWNFGVSKLFRTGGTVNVTFNNNKADTNSIFATVNPNYTSTFSGFATQPLLRDLRIDSERNQLRIAKKNKEITDAQFRQIVINVLASVKQQYYDLLAAADNLDAQRKSLSLAQKLLDENRIKVRVGTLAPLDVGAGRVGGRHARGERDRGRELARGGRGSAARAPSSTGSHPRCGTPTSCRRTAGGRRGAGQHRRGRAEGARPAHRHPERPPQPGDLATTPTSWPGTRRCRRSTCRASTAPRAPAGPRSCATSRAT